jgi:BlaI family transcriptional regulator, penicillinase repressor
MWAMATPRISEAEWIVMEVVWRRHPVTALEVVQELASRKQWQDQTIRTMLRRLTRKKALTYKAEGKVFHYEPAVSREQCVRGESRSFLERVFGGAAQPLLVRLVQETKLSREEIAELKRILRDKAPAEGSSAEGSPAEGGKWGNKAKEKR